VREPMASHLIRSLAVIALLGALASARLACAQESQAVRVASGVQYQLLEDWDVDRMNQVPSCGYAEILWNTGHL
jgi:hypothetical protein